MPGLIAGRASETPQRKVTGEVPRDARRVDTLSSDSQIGDVVVPFRKTITFEQAAVFSRIGEYVLNMHNNLQVARAGELRVPIVQGQQQAGCMAEFLTRTFEAAFFTDG